MPKWNIFLRELNLPTNNPKYQIRAGIVWKFDRILQNTECGSASNIFCEE